MKISLTQVYALLLVLVAYISHVTSQTVPPIYNTDAIPLTANSFLDASAGRRAVYKGWAKTINGYTFSYNQQCVITVTNPSGTILWKNIDYIPTYCQPSALLILGADGNLCTSGSEVVDPFWCTATNAMGGKYLNFLPPNSYGREFAVVIQTVTGRMIWGAFGDITHPDAAYMLIPGNYIDVQNPLLNKLTTAPYLTNGRDQFCLGSDSKLRYFVGNPNNGGTEGSPIVWQSTNTALTTSSNFYFSLYPEDGKACIRSSANPTVDIWCLLIPTGVRYFKLPILDGSGFNPTPSNRERWGFVFQGDGNFFLGGQFNIVQPEISKMMIPDVFGYEYANRKMPQYIYDEYDKIRFGLIYPDESAWYGDIRGWNRFTGAIVQFTNKQNCTIVPYIYRQGLSWEGPLNTFCWSKIVSQTDIRSYICSDFNNKYPIQPYTNIKQNERYMFVAVIAYLPEVFMIDQAGTVTYNYRV